MKALSLSLKLVISNIVFLLPIAWLQYSVLKVIQEKITFTSIESKGIRYITVLEDLLKEIGQHAFLTQSVLSNKKDLKSDLLSLENEIDTKISELESIYHILKQDLKLTEEELNTHKRSHLTMQNLKSKWSQVKSDSLSFSIIENHEKHGEIFDHLKATLAHVGDTSNLILDTDLDSYYMMDATLSAATDLQEKMYDVTLRLDLILKNKTLTLQDRIWLIGKNEFLKASLAKVQLDVQTALIEDQNFYGLSQSLQTLLPPQLEEITKAVEGFIQIVQKVIDGKLEDLNYDLHIKTLRSAFEKTFDFQKLALKELNHLLEIRLNVAQHEKNVAIWVAIVCCLLAVFISSMLGMSIHSSLSKTVSKMTDKMKIIADNVLTSNGKLIEAADDLAAGTAQHASAIQQTVATLDEISSMTSKSASSAANSTTQARSSQEAANMSKRSLVELVSALKQINIYNTDIIQQVQDSNQKILDIVNMIKEIGNKTKVINDIVFQTKLLSFNASVEAARAGEHGKGFAVVAEEVGNLAQMSGNAAKEISSLLEQSMQKVSVIVDETRKNLERTVQAGKEKMDKGMHLADNCEHTLTEAVEKVEKVTVLMDEIAGATKEQATGVAEIRKTMVSVFEKTMQKNAVAAATTSTLAKELEEQSLSIKTLVNDLRKVVYIQHHDVQKVSQNSAKVLKIKSKESKPQDFKHHTQKRITVHGESFPPADDPGFKEG